MASNAVLTYHDGKLDVPEDLRSELHLSEGSCLHVVYTASGKVLLDRKEPMRPSANWRNLEGFLAGSGVDPNAELEAERIRELELDVRP